MTAQSSDAPSFVAGRTTDAVVVPLGHRGVDDPAVTLASRLAGVWGVPLRLFHVTPSISSVDPLLATVASSLIGREPEVDVETVHIYGDDPAVAVAAEIGAHDLPVLSTEQADAWSFKHSVAEALVERAGVPLVLVGPRVDRVEPDGDVVVALDGTEVAATAIDAAVALAKACGRPLMLVRVVADPVTPAGPPDADRLDGEVADPTDLELHPEVGLELQRLADDLDPDVGTRWEVVHGNDPVKAIGALAERIGASFVVAATRGRTDETRTTMCSISMGLVATASCPVLVVHAVS